jgi:NadR type nicotinamide-nucleotide adenylyltransferase
MPLIARGQIAAEEALAREANRVLFCDTDPLATTIWSEALFGACAPEIRAAADGRRYALTLLLDVDVPWVADPVRYLPDERRSFFDRCARALDAHGRRWIRITGAWDARFEQARAAVDALLEEP